MSASNGPSVVTSGLVFYCDMSNTKKSWLGKPTTNLYYAVNNYLNGNGNHWINSGGATYNDNDTSEQPPAESTLPSTLRITSCKTTTVGNQQVGMGITSVSPSTTYTMSVWLKTTHRVWQAGPYMRTNVNNNSIATFDYNGDTNFLNWPTNKWIRLTATGTTQSNENGIYLSSYIGDIVGHKILYYGFQVEQQSFATPVVTGTRSNTQSIIDLTGNNTITASSLTYNSDNTFSFNGTSDYIDTNYDLSWNNTNSATICFWCKPDQVSKNVGIIGKGSDWEWQIRQNGSSLGFVYWNSGGSHSNGPTVELSGIFSANQWKHITVVWSNTANQLYIYVNGSLISTSNWTDASINANKANSVKIGGYTYDWQGGGSYWSGNISAVKFYNRALSASEVKQNFSAARSRYGI